MQAPGKLDLSKAFACADAWAFSAHKFHGPKGVGALVLRKGLELDTLVHGAMQEGGRRGGTHNVPGIVGLAAAARAARANLGAEAARLAGLRDMLWSLVREKVDGVAWNGQGAALLPNTLNVSFESCPSQAMCDEMDARGFALSPGAACRSGDPTPVAHDPGDGPLRDAAASTSVRVSLGAETTRARRAVAGRRVRGVGPRRSAPASDPGTVTRRGRR